MIRGIDHLVIACLDPDRAAAELESTLGLASTGGGRHEGLGTHNRLVFLEDGSYLELIGVTDARLASSSPVGAATLRALERGGGLATFALLVDDLAATVSSGAVIHGSRRRDDGELVEWWTAAPTSPLGPATPFLIEHAYTGREWGPEALEARASFVHPIGSAVRLIGLDVAVEPEATSAELPQWPGLAFRDVAEVAVADVGPHRLRWVPVREMTALAVVTLGADVGAPLTETLLGLRFDFERASLRVPEPNPG